VNLNLSILYSSYHKKEEGGPRPRLNPLRVHAVGTTRSAEVAIDHGRQVVAVAAGGGPAGALRVLLNAQVLHIDSGSLAHVGEAGVDQRVGERLGRCTRVGVGP